jgi:iron-sulfur cluster repair protein YtfE (RIC family)
LFHHRIRVYWQKYIQDYLLRDVGELSELEDIVLSSLQKKEMLVNKIEESDQDLMQYVHLENNVLFEQFQRQTD